MIACQQRKRFRQLKHLYRFKDRSANAAQISHTFTCSALEM